MGPSLAALYALLALHIVAGAQAQPFALLPGQYRLRFPGRMACGVSQGLLSAYRCESQRVRLTVNYRASELTAWALQPVQPGTAVLTNATRVHLVAGGRGVCPGTYATWPVGCTGAVALAPFGQAPVRQQWVVEAWGATWRLRPAACLGAYLSIPKACSGVDAMVQLQSSTAHWNAFSLFRSEDGTAVKPGDAQPPPAPSPAPSPPPVASPPPPVVPSPPPPVVPSPPPPVVPSPPLPVVPSPPPSPPPEPSPGTNVEAAVVESARWALGFEGSFRITNRNPFDILNWKLSFAVVGAGNFTWGPSDVDVTWRGALGELVPKEWLREIKAGATLEIKFGGRGAAPSDARFTQILPLVDPDNDPSLKARGVFPAKVFAPFIDATLYPTPRLLDAWEATGQKWFTLAFITADLAKKTPAWGGVIGMEKQYFVDQIRDVRLKGGDVIVSFGGAAGQELAQVVADEDALLGMYQQVVDLYRLRWIDFDIEGQACAQPESIDRRNRVLRRLQAANPGLTLSYTLPVLPAGLTADGVKLLRSCVANGVRVDVLNIMTMDYGDSAAPNPDGRMGDYAIQAAQNTYQQALEIGNTPMIGLNDVETETFYLADAQKLAAWARATPWVRWTAFWSIGRDKYNGEKYVSIHSSSIPQQPFDFTRAFQAVAQ